MPNLYWKCKCGLTRKHDQKDCPRCGKEPTIIGWYVRVKFNDTVITKFFKDYELAVRVEEELKRKQELTKLAKRLKGVDDDLASIIQPAADEKGRWIKLKTFWAKYITWLETNRKKSTVRERISRWNARIKKYFGDKYLSEITPQLVSAYQTYMKNNGYDNATINRDVAMLRHIITMAVKWNYLTHHTLLSKIDMLQEPKDRWTFLSKEEFDRVFENLSETYHDICYFLVYTGARLGEALSLKWENIIWESGVAYLPDSKANRERVLVLSDSILEMLKKRYEKLNPNPNDRIFQHSDSEFRRAFKKALEKAGLPRTIRIHDLRHTFASWLAMRKVPLQQIKDLLGHSQISTTLRYAHLNSETLRKTVAVLEDKIENTQKQYKENKIINFNQFLKKKENVNTLKAM